MLQRNKDIYLPKMGPENLVQDERIESFKIISKKIVRGHCLQLTGAAYFLTIG
jgi:hypothetical protein